MKNWQQSVFFGMVAIIALSFGFIGCDDGHVVTVKRNFTITITETVDSEEIEVAIIPIIDTRTGADDEDLEELGVIETLTNRLNLDSVKGTDGFKAAVERLEFAIYIEKTTAYASFKAYNENKLGLNLDFLIDQPVYIILRLRTAFNHMENGPFPYDENTVW
jgi:hypothetical protein